MMQCVYFLFMDYLDIKFVRVMSIVCKVVGNTQTWYDLSNHLSVMKL